MKNDNYYCLALESSNPEITYYPKAELRKDLKEIEMKPKDMNTFDMKIFNTLKESETYFKKYMKILKGLDNKKICLDRKLPTILYKRRYMVQTLMGEKMFTKRDSPRVQKMMSKLKVGDMFNLNDQTYFLTVVLTKVAKVDSWTYKYEFKLP